MIVREMRRGDADQVAHEMQLNFGEELALKGWDPDHFTNIVNRSFEFPAGTILVLLRAFHRSPVHLLVGEEGGRVVATTFLFFQKSHGYIAAVQTDPAFRGKGFANALLDQAEASCRKRARRWVVLDVLSDNTTARRIYERRGYRPIRVQHWLFRELGQPKEAFGSAGPGVRPMEKGDLNALLDLYQGQQPPDVRKVLAPERAHVSPPHYLQNMMSAISMAWCTGPPGAPTAYLRATFTTPKQAGNLSAPLLSPRCAPVERAELLEAGLAWLAANGARRVVTEVPGYAQDALTLLREAGFESRFTMDTMLLTLDASSSRT